MPFIRTNPRRQVEGRLACDWPGCPGPAMSPTFLYFLVPNPLPEGWASISRGSELEFFCPDHADAARAQRAA